MQIIPKILINYNTPALKYGGDYAEFIRDIMAVVVNQRLYSNTFYNLVHAVLKSKGWKQKDLEECFCWDRKKITRTLHGKTKKKEVVIAICMALGLDLVSTMIFLIAYGIILNPVTDEIDYKYMLFIDKVKFDGFKRIDKWNEYIQDEKFWLGC